jgi:prepilin-type N-terminal cleavage/methylation domain-containing protein
MLQSQSKSGRKKLKVIGFTLAEILVALALISLLAAVLLPTVAGQLLKGDAVRVSEDLSAVRSGIEQFLADVHRYPGKYSQLASSIKTGTHLDIHGSTITSGLASKWGGPYVTKDTLAGATVTTGFGASILNAFSKTANTNGIDYVTVSITGIDSLDFLRLDEQVDGTANAAGGILRWVTGTTRYLAIPIQ